MTTRRKMTSEEVSAAVAELSGWSVKEGKLHKSYEFGSFVEAMGFMMKVALIAEKLDHHPEWFNVYNRVEVNLNTHDLGGISTYDFELAKNMDKLQ